MSGKRTEEWISRPCPFHPPGERKPCSHQMLRRAGRGFVSPLALLGLITAWHCKNLPLTVGDACWVIIFSNSRLSHSSRYQTLGCNLYQSQLALPTWKLWNHSTFKLFLSFSTPRGVWNAGGFSFALCSSATDPPWPQAQHCWCTGDLCRHHPAMPLPNNRASRAPWNSSDSQKSSLGPECKQEAGCKDLWYRNLLHLLTYRVSSTSLLHHAEPYLQVFVANPKK